MSPFSLEKDPFPQAGGDEFYFSTPALAARLQELCGAIEGGHVLLIDEEGSGKSTMLDGFVAAVSERWRVFRLQARGNQSAREFAHDLVSTFGLPTREPPAAELRDADTLLELLTARSQTAVIVIDDVHRLQPGALEQLLYLAWRWQDHSVRFLICAEPSLVEQLESLNEGGSLPGTVATFHMPRFDQEQVSDYLHMCLFRAGLVGDSPFDPGIVATVTEKAGGLVGAIDPLARELLGASGAGGRENGRNGHGQAAARRWPVALVAAAGLGVLLTVAAPGPGQSQAEGQSRRHLEVFRSSITVAPRRSTQIPRDRSAAADSIAP